MVVSLACLLAGCSGSDLPDLGQVHGVVTVDGAPYPNARVEFSPKTGRPSEGVTDASGKYVLKYMPEVPGAELGDHTVRITTLYQSPENPDDAKPFTDPIPSQYNVESGYTATVNNGENEYNFDIKTK